MLFLDLMIAIYLVENYAQATIIATRLDNTQ